MTAEPGGGESPKHTPYELYGFYEHQLGEVIFMFLDHMASPSKEMPFASGEPPKWTRHDRGLFSVFTDIGRCVPGLEYGLKARKSVGQEASHTDVKSRFPALGGFYAALPFTDVERRWLDLQQTYVWGIDKDNFTWTGAFPYDERILTLGRWEGNDRTDIVRRWPAWLRGCDEFEDGSQLEAAEEALTELGRELLMGDLGDHPPSDS